MKCSRAGVGISRLTLVAGTQLIISFLATHRIFSLSAAGTAGRFGTKSGLKTPPGRAIGGRPYNHNC
jgi:hypothetical protein